MMGRTLCMHTTNVEGAALLSGTRLGQVGDEQTLPPNIRPHGEWGARAYVTHERAQLCVVLRVKHVDGSQHAPSMKLTV